MNKPIESVTRWLQEVVIGLNFCPFAKRELLNNTVRFVESPSTTEAGLMQNLAHELTHLTQHREVETTLLIHPQVLQNFEEYNQFLNLADALIEEMGLLGEFQVASFHPDYQFANTEFDDAENYTNRSPYPLLHILREASLEAAIDKHPNTELIPTTNIRVTQSLGKDKMRALLQRSLDV